jgi:hypothetical protein
MEIEAWLQAAMADAERRGLPELAPFLTALARATEALRRVECEAHANPALQPCSGRPERESRGESRVPNPDAGADD